MRLVVILLACLISVSAAAQEKTSGGRFQLIQLSNMRRDQYMIDTQTGKVWAKVCTAPIGDDCDASAWTLNDVEGITASRIQIQKTAEAVQRLQESEAAAKASKGTSK